VALGGNLYERGDSYFVIVRVKGEQRVAALQARNRTDAKREAPRVLARLLNRRSGIGAGDPNVTLRELADDFLAHEGGPSGRLAPRTLELRRLLLTKHVLPGVGEKTKASEITSAHVRKFIDKLRRKGLSGSSVRGCVASLSCVLDHGVRNDSLGRNVCRDLVRGDLPSAKRTTEPRYLTTDQVRKLLDELGEEFRVIAAACFYGGLRVSEALSLRWGDIDFDTSTIAVRGTKTAASAATIPLLPRLAEELRAHRQRQAGIGLVRIKPDALVFVTFPGQPQSRRNTLRAVNAASVKAGLVKDGQERVGCHDLRHSLAANAFALGLSPVEVSKLLRHSNTAVTLSTYAGLAEDHIELLGTKLAAMGDGS
jgi:integrase